MGSEGKGKKVKEAKKRCVERRGERKYIRRGKGEEGKKDEDAEER